MNRLASTVGFALLLLIGSLLLLWDREVTISLMGRPAVLAASSLLDGRGFELAAGTPYARRAPLYPALLALLGFVGATPKRAVMIIGCASFAATGLAFALLARALALRQVVGALLFFVCFAPIVYLLRSGMPDLFHVGLTLFALAGLANYAATGTPRALAGTLVAASLAALSFYLALFTLFPLIAVGLWIAGGRAKRRARDLGLFAVIACVPIGAWLVRNLLLTGYVTGMPRAGVRSSAAFGDFIVKTDLTYNLASIARTAALDLFGPNTLGLPYLVHAPEAPDGLVPGAFLLALSAVLLGAVVWSRRAAVGNAARAALLAGERAGYAVAITSTYVVWFPAVLIALWTLSNNDPIYTRYLAPVYLPAALLVGWLDGAIAASGLGGWMRLSLLIVFLFCAGLQAPKSVALLGPDPGPALLQPNWQESGNFWEHWPTWRQAHGVRMRERGAQSRDPARP